MWIDERVCRGRDAGGHPAASCSARLRATSADTPALARDEHDDANCGLKIRFRRRKVAGARPPAPLPAAATTAASTTRARRARRAAGHRRRHSPSRERRRRADVAMDFCGSYNVERRVPGDSAVIGRSPWRVYAAATASASQTNRGTYDEDRRGEGRDVRSRVRRRRRASRWATRTTAARTGVHFTSAPSPSATPLQPQRARTASSTPSASSAGARSYLNSQ